MQRGLGRKKYLSVQAVKVSAAHIWSQAKKVASLSHFFFFCYFHVKVFGQGHKKANKLANTRKNVNNIILEPCSIGFVW